MDDYLKSALEIVQAQASVRPMTDDQIASMISSVAAGIKAASEGIETPTSTVEPAVDPKKAIKETSIICLECGKSFKVITKKHLASHGLTKEEYLEKYSMKKGTSLCCKSLQRERRKKMKEMRLWEKRKKSS
jgi:predicted transcriptional regulator